MQCPKCAIPLHMAERSGIEIDYCPQCRGVWLDRGELDKIIERSGLPQRPAEKVDPTPYNPQGDRHMRTPNHQGSYHGVCSRNGKNRTLSLGEHPERPKFTLLDQLVLPPDVVAGQVDVLPAQGRQMRQQLLIDVLPSVA